MSFEEHLTRDARLVIVKELSLQLSGGLNETILTTALDTFGHRRSRDWVRTQLFKLEELGAISITKAGSILVASITASGRDHVELRSVIEGIARPSPAI